MLPRDQLDRRLPRDEVTTVLTVHVADRRAHLALHAVEPAPHALDLVLKLEHLLDAGEVQAELVRQLLDQAQALQVGVGVQPRVSAGALRPDQSLALVDAQRLWVHPDEVGRHRDHVTRTIVHHSSSSLKCRSCSSLRRMSTKVTSTPTVPTLTRRTAASFN